MDNPAIGITASESQPTSSYLCRVICMGYLLLVFLTMVMPVMTPTSLDRRSHSGSTSKTDHSK